LGHGLANPHPVGDSVDFAKWNTSLDHPDRGRVHSQKKHALATVAETTEVFLVRLPGVEQGIVHMHYGRAEAELLDRLCKRLGRLDEGASSH
jgi:hypothetical protein